MNESPYLRLKPMRHPSSAQSPNRPRIPDDILAHLGPATAIDALSTATGALRKCLDGASGAEQEFAMRTAVAARRVWEWVDELQDWSWPSEGGSAGFEPPGGTRRKLFVQVTAPEGEKSGYMGSLPVEVVAKYEKRLAEIQQGVEELDVEEIKSHVLTNHILPLSRPGTPMSDAASTCSTYIKMEDLTAVITAIVVQTLPFLAKLSRLLQIWDRRLNVLRRVPSLLLDIEDAEVALKSGWNAISRPSTGTELEVVPEEEDDDDDEERGDCEGGGERGRGDENKLPLESTLTRKDFDIMRLVLEKKISKPGRCLDHMLDCLEGMHDTLPEEWLDRMEAVETEYAEWVAACEQKIRESEWAKANAVRPGKSLESVKDAHAGDVEDPSDQGHDTSIISEASEATTVIQGSPGKETLSDETDGGAVLGHTKSLPALQDPISFDRTGDAGIPSARVQPPTPRIVGVRVSLKLSTRAQQTPDLRFEGESDSGAETPGTDSGEDEPELPPLRGSRRRNSNESQASDVLDGSSQFGGFLSSDMPEVSVSPNLPTSRIREAEYLQASPPSSPPRSAHGMRGSDLTPFGSPMEALHPDEDEFPLPRTPPRGSFADDFDDSFSFTEVTGSHDRRESVGDQHLRQQISQIIGSIPAKIKLSTEPSVNLNPPDLQLPRMRKKSSVEPFKRSASSISSRAVSRAGTPSFTLSPAKNPRPRRRGQQEIKVYHLSRSNGEAPIKLFIRCVGESGERVMVRVGGGWADLGEYLKEYANHHKHRSAALRDAKVEVGERTRLNSSRGSNVGSSPPSARPGSALDASPVSPLVVRKTRPGTGAVSSEAPRLRPSDSPAVPGRPATQDGPNSGESNRSRSSSHLSWAEDDSSFLGLAGPTGKKVEMSDENRAWVESVKEKVRLASGELMASGMEDRNRFGDLGRVGGTKRVFRKPEERRNSSWR